MEHPSVSVIRRGYNAFATGDIDTLKELIAPDAIWYSPGKNPISGTYRGFEAILGYFGKFSALSDGQFQLEVLDIFASDQRGVALTRDTVTRNGKTLSWEGGVVFTLQAGKVIEAWSFNRDQDLVDQFWS